MSIEGKASITGAARKAAGGGEVRTQYAALCWRRIGERTEVLLITSRDTGRWIIPKGWPMKGRKPWEAALQEAFEEAGVAGKPCEDATGQYPYLKMLDADHGIPCLVTVYPVKVSKLLDSFPERSERRRKWFTPKKAAQKVDEPELQALLRTFRAPDAKPKRTRKGG